MLDAGQRARLEEIQLQAAGPLAFLCPEVHVRLNMNPGQIESANTAVSEGWRAMRQAAAVPTAVLPSDTPRKLGDDERSALLESKAFAAELQKARDSVLKARRATMDRITRVLTKRQRANYQKMLGEPFDFAKSWPAAAPAENKAPQETKAGEGRPRAPAR